MLFDETHKKLHDEYTTAARNYYQNSYAGTEERRKYNSALQNIRIFLDKNGARFVPAKNNVENRRF